MRRLMLAVLAAASFALSGPARAATTDEASDAGAALPADEGLGKRLGGFATVSLGLPGVDFVNELVGARFELEYTPRFAFGLSLAYANLKGKDGRVSNALPEASLAYTVPLGASFRIPIRFAGGWLPKNGPTLRLGSGFEWAPSHAMAFELVLLEPMVWVARDRPELAMNLGAAVLGRF